MKGESTWSVAHNIPFCVGRHIHVVVYYTAHDGDAEKICGI